MRRLCVSVVLGFGLVSMSLSQATQPSVSPTPALPDIPAWRPPAARDTAKTPFSPNPLTGDNIFKGEAERWLAQAIIDVEVGLTRPIEDKQISEYIARLGAHVVKYSREPTKQFEFVVLPNDRENAFAIGGGRVFIYVGMLKAVSSEDELAAVLAHEIGHDVFMHAPKTVTRQMFWMTGTRKVGSAAETEKALESLLEAYERNTFAVVGEALLGWSRFAELEADKAGFYNMFKAGYNPEAMKETFGRWVRIEKEDAGDEYARDYFLTLLFGSHPPSSQRVTALKWESNFVKMPKNEERHSSPAFASMKKRVARL